VLDDGEMNGKKRVIKIALQDVCFPVEEFPGQPIDLDNRSVYPTNNMPPPPKFECNQHQLNAIKVFLVLIIQIYTIDLPPI